MVSFSIFALALTKSLPQMVSFSIFTQTLTKGLPQMVFSFFLPYAT